MLLAKWHIVRCLILCTFTNNRCRPDPLGEFPDPFSCGKGEKERKGQEGRKVEEKRKREGYRPNEKPGYGPVD